MQKPTTSTPHDAVFKKFLGHPDTARDFLDTYLPSSLHELCDLDTLKLEPGSFIEEDLRACYSDVLWSLKTTSGKGYIYALIEHQSSPDAHMAFRMMRMPLLRCRSILMQDTKRCRWWCRYFFIMALTARIHTRCVGWMNLTIQKPHGSFMVLPSRW